MKNLNILGVILARAGSKAVPNKNLLKVGNKSLSFKENMLSLMYAEVQKNLETLRYIEASSMPSFSIIDQPFSPIRAQQKSWFKYTFIYALLISVFIFCFFYFRKMIKKYIDNI